MEANRSRACPGPILSPLWLSCYALTFGVLGLSIAEAQTPRRAPVERVEKPAKNLEVVPVRTRVLTDAGALVVYDTPQAEGEARHQAGYLADWHEAGSDEVFVYARVNKKRSDLVHALLWLRHDFGVDPHDLAPDVFTDDLPDPPDDPMESVENRAWFPGTRRNVMIIAGLWEVGEFDASEPPPVIARGPCLPCRAAAAGGNAVAALADDPTDADVYGAAVVAACDCCEPPEPCPPSCNDNNACTRDYYDRNCYFCYCVHESRTCNDDNKCTNDSCHPSTGACVFQPKNCDDRNVCTWDTCNPLTRACKNTPRCSDRVCCPAGSSYFCCNAGEEVCCPSNPAYADHCCESGGSCCAGGCCAAGMFCCDGQTCCPNGWDCRNGQCCEGPWCEATCCGVQDTCCGAGCCPLESPQCCNAVVGLCCRPDAVCCGETCCSTDATCCGNRCCDAAHHCCADGVTCCEDGQECCDGQCCPVDYHCCGDPGVCCPPEGTCCNGACCDGPCCDATGECCAAGGSCCNNECCAAQCCGGACCPGGPLCCGDGCCAAGQSCCNAALHLCCNVAAATSSGEVAAAGEECCVNQCCQTGFTCCGGTVCCPAARCCANGTCCADSCDECLIYGDLSAGTITADPNPVCVGDALTFTVSGVSDSGGRKRLNCSPVDILPGGVTYDWTLTLPSGYPAPLPPLTGTGATVNVVAKVAGVYSCSFVAKPTRTDCPPADLQIAPQTGTGLTGQFVENQGQQTYGFDSYTNRNNTPLVPYKSVEVARTDTAILEFNALPSGASIQITSSNTANVTVTPATTSTSPQTVTVQGVATGSADVTADIGTAPPPCTTMTVAAYAKPSPSRKLAIILVHEENDDVQIIPVGQGQPNAIAIEAGPNGVINSTPGGDDAVTVLNPGTPSERTVITTGANGVCNTTVHVDDVQVIPSGQGWPNVVCVGKGANNFRDSVPAADDLVTGDDINTGPDGVCNTTAKAVNTLSTDVGTAAQVQAFLDGTVYNQAVFSWTVTKPAPRVVNFDLNRDGKIDVDSWMNPEMAAIRDAAQDLTDDNLVFLVDNPSDGSTGFMASKQRYGFVHADTSIDDDRTVAHELGHGGFDLAHTPDDSENIMYNYSSTTKWRLRKGQWDTIHGP